MNINLEGTRTGRLSCKTSTKSNRPKGQGKVVATDDNGRQLMMDEDIGEPGTLPPGVEIVGMHLGPRTKWNHPYSYDPILQFSTGEQPDGSCYSDRLMSWYGYDVVRKTMQKHFGEQGDYWNQRKPEAIQGFLRELLSYPELKLTRIEEHCNVATGYPVWFFAYQRGAKPEVIDMPAASQD